MKSESIPRYQQIARQLKAAIEQGELNSGKRLPSSRMYAQELGVSRVTVENAYGELVAQGWLERRGQAGTFVSDHLTLPSVDAQPLGFGGEQPRPQPFQLGLPALDLFPRGLWARVMGRRLRTQTRYDLALGDVCGEMTLRQALVEYLRLSRSIECQAEQVFITSGYAASISLILRSLGGRGESMWVEDPGFPLIRPVIEQEGVTLCPVPVDAQGMDVEWAIQQDSEARFALLTPAHQSPTGAALSLPRRRQLLDWAAHHKAWIIEDDYDSEFRYQGKPLPPLKSLDAPQRVLYAGTFSKSLFPALRTAWLVVPLPLVETFRQQAQHLACPVPLIMQQTLADFMREGHFWRHLKKMRVHYAQRRRWLEDALVAHGFQVVEQLGGIQLLVAVNGNDRAMALSARRAGLAVQAVNDWRLGSEGPAGLIMSFTNIMTRAMADAQVSALRAAIK